jgi:hypothetical protein
MAFLNDALSPEVGQFFRDQLEALIAAEFDREYPVHYKECVPVTDIEDGLDGYSDTITYRQYDSYGTLSVVSDQKLRIKSRPSRVLTSTHRIRSIGPLHSAVA